MYSGLSCCRALDARASRIPAARRCLCRSTAGGSPAARVVAGHGPHVQARERGAAMRGGDRRRAAVTGHRDHRRALVASATPALEAKSTRTTARGGARGPDAEVARGQYRHHRLSTRGHPTVRLLPDLPGRRLATASSPPSAATSRPASARLSVRRGRATRMPRAPFATMWEIRRFSGREPGATPEPMGRPTARERLAG